MTLMEALAPIALASLALCAASAVAHRLGRTGAFRWLDTGLVWIAIVAVPPYALGWAGLFRAHWVALASFATSTLVLAAATRARWPALLEAALALPRALAAPLALAASAFERRAFTTAIALLIAIAVWAWTALLAWLVPSSGWDGIWYHDTIVGFTIQNAGFGEVALPREHELINGYPRLVETIAAFFVVLADDRFLEVAPTLAWPWVGVALAALATGLTRRRDHRVAAACAFVLVPALAMQLRSSYIDVPTSFFAMAGVAYVTRRRLTPVDLALAGLACGLLLASKATGLLQVPVLGTIALVRVLARPRRTTLCALAGATLVIAAIGAPTYVRNTLRHDNPIWPISRDVDLLGIRLEGLNEEPIRSPSLATWIEDVYGRPQWEEYHHDVRPDGYGRAFPLLLPAVLAAAIVTWLAGEGRRRRARGTPMPWVALAGIGLALATPPLWWGRFGVPVLACGVALAVGWLGTRPRACTVALALVVLVHAVTLTKARPGWHASLDDARVLLRRSPEQRAAFPVGPVFGDEPTLLAFESEVGPGDVVVWTSPNGFPSFAWNRHMSNRSVYEARVSLQRLDELDARWVIVAARSPVAHMLDRSTRFERVGPITDVLVGYRRVMVRDTLSADGQAGGVLAPAGEER